MALVLGFIVFGFGRLELMVNYAELVLLRACYCGLTEKTLA